MLVGARSAGGEVPRANLLGLRTSPGGAGWKVICISSVVALLAVLVGAALAAAIFWPPLRGAERRRAMLAGLLATAQREARERADEARRQQDLFAAVLDAFPRPVIICDRDRVIRFANQAVSALTHLPREQMIGRVAASAIQDTDTIHLLMEVARTGAACERTFQRATTGQTWHVVVTPLRARTVEPLDAEDDHPAQLMLTIEDITEIRRLEMVRRDFVAHVSHELRTPLAAVKLLSDTLAGALDGDRGTARTFAERISAEIDHLAQMVAELLELSRIESGKIQLRLEPTDLPGLVEAVIDRMRPLAGERQISLEAEMPLNLPDAQADAARLGEVLINLIHNGLKYTPAGGRVTISAGLRATPDTDAPPYIVVRVTDTGVGIGEEDLPRVFERFFKVDRARTRDTEPVAHDGRGAVDSQVPQTSAAAGTGLGLAIARHLVELHGGEIWAESRIGRGSTFSFTVPVTTADDTSGTEPPHAAHDAEHVTTEA